MKNFLPLFIFVFVCAVAQAQTSQGSMMLGGTFQIESFGSQGNDAKTSTFSISPSFGYFISDNLAVGATIGFGSTTTTNPPAPQVKSSGVIVGPFARFYKFTSNENFAFYAEGGINIGSSTSTGDIRSSSTAIYVRPGFAYFFNEKWALDMTLAGIAYQSNDPNKNVDNDKSNTFRFGVSSFSPSFGFRYFFGQ